MALEILRDPRVRAVAWRDLLDLTWVETARELLIAAPWFLGGLALFHLTCTVSWAYAPLALLCTFFFFLTGLRLVHGAYHHAIGLPRLGCDLVMFALSVLMLGSMHAVMVNHLHHHKHCMDEEDWEAMSARMSGAGAVLLGPVFPLALHWRAFRIGTRAHCAWIVAELLANAAWIAAVLLLIRWPALQCHLAAMALGQCFTAFFAVWTVHHDCDRSHFIARTLRGKLRTVVTYDMFFHVEHHLFPAVPTCRLPALAERLDREAPELQTMRVF